MVRKLKTKRRYGAGTALCGSLMLGFVLIASSFANAQAWKVSSDLQSLTSTKDVQVIVQYYAAPGKSDLALAKAEGAVHRNDFRPIHAHHMSMTRGAAMRLVARNRNIKYISLNRKVRSAADYAVNTVGADIAMSMGLDGTGVGVAVIDSGVQPVADLGVPNSTESRVVYSQNFEASGNATSDLYGHGTHVAGIIAGNGASSQCPDCTYTVRGVAPNANIVSLRVLDANGSGSDSDLIAAIQRAIELKDKYNIRVINLSVGRGVYETYTLDPLCQAVEQAWNAGIVVVAAAGNFGRDNSNNNNGYGTITAPGNDPFVITVGAMNTMATPDRADDVIATYSSKGPSLVDHTVKPDVVAPGNRIVSLVATPAETLYQEFPSNGLPLSQFRATSDPGVSTTYFSLSGTSMATPMVAGAVALLLQQDPSLTPDQVKARLMKTADKQFPQFSSITDPTTGQTFNETYDIFTVGAGYLDIPAALANTDPLPSTVGAAKSPAAAVDDAGNVYLVNDPTTVWSNSIMWGTSSVWGTSIMWGTSTQGQSIMWGTSSTEASSIMWGTSAQGESIMWGSSIMWGASGTDAMSVLAGGDR